MQFTIYYKMSGGWELWGTFRKAQLLLLVQYKGGLINGGVKNSMTLFSERKHLNYTGVLQFLLFLK